MCTTKLSRQWNRSILFRLLLVASILSCTIPRRYGTFFFRVLNQILFVAVFLLHLTLPADTMKMTRFILCFEPRRFVSLLGTISPARYHEDGTILPVSRIKLAIFLDGKEIAPLKQQRCRLMNYTCVFSCFYFFVFSL